jgi:hypothetical protein
MVDDTDSNPDGKEELAAFKQDAKKLLRRRTKRATYATAAFLLSCASVTPFLAGFPLHAYWESFGKFFLLLSMTLLLPFVVLIGRAINAWFFARDIKKMDEWT